MEKRHYVVTYREKEIRGENNIRKKKREKVKKRKVGKSVVAVKRKK